MAISAAIETPWNGCNFRSRLEARWSIFFDAAGIPWEYEMRAIGVRWQRRRINWLPDFWLPDSAMWGEVKGNPSLEMPRLLHLASGVSTCPRRTGPHGGDMAVFGNLPPWSGPGWPLRLHRHGPDLIAVPWDPARADCPLPCPYITGITSSLLVNGFPVIPPEWADEPLNAARRWRWKRR
jgi:hypothetical protein